MNITRQLALTLAGLTLTGCGYTSTTQVPDTTVQHAADRGTPSQTEIETDVSLALQDAPYDTTITVEGDDVILRLPVNHDANAAQTYAPYVLQDAVERMQPYPDTGLRGVDLVAVYSADDVMLTYQGLWR